MKSFKNQGTSAQLLAEKNLVILSANKTTASVLELYESAFWDVIYKIMKEKRVQIPYGSDIFLRSSRCPKEPVSTVRGGD